MSFIDAISAFSTKLSTQRHINAIRNAFYVMMPLIIAASLFVLINNVILSASWMPPSLSVLKDIGDRVYRGTLGIMTLIICVATSYNLAQSYKADGLFSAVVSLAALITFLPAINKFGDTEVYGALHAADTSVSGVFVGFIVALLATELYIRLSKIDKLKIKMPEGVPPAVSKSFSALIPAILTLTILAVAAFLLDYLFHVTLSHLIITFIQNPLNKLVGSFGGFMLLIIILHLLWGIGLHGSFVLGPIIEPILGSAVIVNTEAFNAGLEVPNIVTKPFLDAFLMMGGSGTTIGLIIAIFLFSKREDFKVVSKISLIPGLFNINETIIFGLPIVFNPLMIIPFVLVPVINLTIAYWATAFGIISKTVTTVPWTTPPVIGAYLATGGDWKAAVMSVILLAISVVIYSPFVIASNRLKPGN